MAADGLPDGADGLARLVTQRLYKLRDGVPRLAQLSRIAIGEQTTDGGATWTAVHRGYTNRLELEGGEYALTIGDTTRIEQQTELFRTLPLVDPATLPTPLPMPKPRVGMILGGPVALDATYGAFAGVRDYGATRWHVDEQHSDQGPLGTTRVLRLKFQRGYLRPWYQKVWTSFKGSDSRLDNDGNESDERDYVNKAVEPYFQWDPVQFRSPLSATVNYFGFFPDLTAQLTPVSGGTVLEATPIARPIRFESGNREKPKGEYDALVGNDSTMYLAWGDQAWPGIGAQFDVTLFSRVISDANPVLLAGHPVDLVAYAAALIGVPVDDASRITCKAALGDGHWLEGFLTPQKFADFAKMLCGDYRFLFRVNQATGLRQFVPIGPRPPSSFAVTAADRVSGSDDGSSQPKIWEVAEDSVVNGVDFEGQRLSWYRFKQDGTDPPAHMIASKKATIQGVRGDTTVNGSRTVTFSVPGQRLLRAADGSTTPLAQSYYEDLGGALIDYAGWGVVQTVVLLDPESPAASALVGDEGTLDLPDLPTPLAGGAPLTTRGAGPRVVRVVKVTPQEGAVEVTYALAGELSQTALTAPSTSGSMDAGLPLAPTLTLAASSTTPLTVVTVTLTNGATLAIDNLRTELETLTQTATPASTDSGRSVGPVTTYPLGDATTFDLPPVAPGSTVWVRAQSRNTASGVASAWTAWTSLALGTVVLGGTTADARPYAPTAPQIAATVDGTTGVVSATVTAPGAVSVKCVGSTSGVPTDAAVRAGTPDTSAPFTFAGLATLTVGQTATIAAFAYDATGNESAKAVVTVPFSAAVGPATNTELGLVCIDGTPTDPAEPHVYVVEAIDALDAALQAQIDALAAGVGGGTGGTGGTGGGTSPARNGWRLYATAAAGGAPAGAIGFAEIAFRATVGGANECTGGTVGASSFVSDPARALDGDSGTYWEAASAPPGWWSYERPTAFAVNEVAILPRAGWAAKAPADFAMQYLSGGAWVTDWSVTGATFTDGVLALFQRDAFTGGTGGTGGTFTFATSAEVATEATARAAADAVIDTRLDAIDDALADHETRITTLEAGGGGSALTVQDEGSALTTAATALNFVGAGVTASGTGATKTITIPGGGSGTTFTAYDVDLRPASAHAKDREFDSSADLAALTWDNQGTSTATVQNGALVIVPQINGGVAHSKRSLWDTVPSGSFTVTAQVTLETARNYANQAGIILRASTGDKRLILAVFVNSSAVVYLIVSRLTGATTNSGDVYAVPWGPGAAAFVPRLVYNSSTGLVSCYASASGRAFGAALYSENISAFLGTPTHSGVFADTLSASSLLVTVPFLRYQATATPADYEGGLRTISAP